MSVRFKFRSSVNFDSININGHPSISVRDLRLRIIQQLNLKIYHDFDLVITDANTAQVKLSDFEAIMKKEKMISELRKGYDFDQKIENSEEKVVAVIMVGGPTKDSYLLQIFLIGFYDDREFALYVSAISSELNIPVRYLREDKPHGSAGALFNFRDVIMEECPNRPERPVPVTEQVVYEYVFEAAKEGFNIDWNKFCDEIGMTRLVRLKIHGAISKIGSRERLRPIKDELPEYKLQKMELKIICKMQSKKGFQFWVMYVLILCIDFVDRREDHQAIDILLAEIDIYELFAFKHCKGRKAKLALCEVSLGETVKARLKQFSMMNNLKRSALMVVAEHLSMEEVAGIKESFQLMDVNNNGKITLGELKVGLGKIGHNVPNADLQILMETVKSSVTHNFCAINHVLQNNNARLFLQADVDGNGTLDFGEYVAAAIHLKKIGNDEYLRKVFTFFDKNKSEYIEIEELRNALADEVDTNNEEVITTIIHDVDTTRTKLAYKDVEIKDAASNISFIGSSGGDACGTGDMGVDEGSWIIGDIAEALCIYGDVGIIADDGDVVFVYV
ncbi:hypothetical protein GIB67_029982 [Kingdonia uniflora]|uniref:Calmodulin n=1 Tax=Kingdonia uniflora TaxID=39325 RepID=A0A7J7MY48_9MAGN|nr:hypothetical protein GIB67_029982 [Kingdonia uniflora]